MKFDTIDEMEDAFKRVIQDALPEKREIELEYGGGETGDVSTNIALKFKDKLEAAESVKESLLKSGLSVERAEISESGHVNIFLSGEWKEVLLDLFSGRGLDILEKRGGTICLNPKSKSEKRIRGYRKAMREIASLRGVEVEYGESGETVELSDMETSDDLSEAAADIISVSRANKTEIRNVSASKSNSLSNPEFKWSYIDYRLENLEKILKLKENAGCAESGKDDSRIWRLLLFKLKLKKAADEALKFKDPSKFYSWKEKYLDMFYELTPYLDNFTAKTASSLRLKQRA